MKVEVKNWKIEVSKWDKNSKMGTIVAGSIFLIERIVSLFANINIPGVGCISLGLFLFGLGIKEINLFKDSNKKSDLILGIILVAMFSVCLYMGIIQIQSYFGVY